MHEDYLPVEWNDNERMRVMLGAMPQPKDNVAHQARINFWTAAVIRWLMSTKKLTFTLQDAQRAFQRGTQQPLCLPEILSHMHKKAELVPVTELPNLTNSEETWLSWGNRIFIASPSRYAWTSLKQAVGVNILANISLVSTSLLESNIKGTHRENLIDFELSPKPIDLDALYLMRGEKLGGINNMFCVVEALVRQRRAAMTVHDQTTYVKFAQLGDIKAPVITQLDLAEKRLYNAQQELETRVTALTQDIAKFRKEAKEASLFGLKVKALSALRRKKRAEASLELDLKKADNVAACLLQLQEAHMNKSVLGAYQVGVTALHEAVAGKGDEAALTMDQLQEVLEEVEDVSSSLAGGVGQQEETIDNLEAELEQLMTDGKTQASNTQDMELPEIPASNPLSEALLEDMSSTPLPSWS
ncbi:unnamed protein product, partial [Meganyctiphanes norvegica]